MSRLAALQAEQESQQTALSQELGHLETAFLQAGETGFLWRARRVTQAQHAYFTTAQNLFTVRWQYQLTAAMLAVFNQIMRATQGELTACQATMSRLKAVRRALPAFEPGRHAPGEGAGVTTQTLLSSTLGTALFERYAPPVADVLAALFNGETSPLDWHDLTPATSSIQLRYSTGAALWPA